VPQDGHRDKNKLRFVTADSGDQGLLFVPDECRELITNGSTGVLSIGFPHGMIECELDVQEAICSKSLTWTFS
jgi:hypothetical protein